jgi:hypothetical protein
MYRGKNQKKAPEHAKGKPPSTPPGKPVEPHRDWSPTVIDNAVERKVGTANPARVPGKGRPSA